MSICDHPREKGPFDAVTLYAGFCKYDAIPSFSENVIPLGLIVAGL